MRMEGDEVHTETDEARGGSTPHIVRWVLGISTLAAIVLLSAVWIIGARSQGDIEEEITASGMIRDIEDNDGGSDTDGIVIDDADEMQSETVDTPVDTIPNETPADTDL